VIGNVERRRKIASASHGTQVVRGLTQPSQELRGAALESETTHALRDDRLLA
jgi:hypothetical protein